MGDLILQHPVTGKVLFHEWELVCPCCGKGVLAPGFDYHLVYLRVALGFPLIPTSCCRCDQHNEEVGGHPKSLHNFETCFHPTEGTAAIDFRVTDGSQRAQLVQKAMSLDWCVGVDGNLVHLDRRRDFIHNKPLVLFTYK